MIKSVLVINTQGKPRLTKFYDILVLTDPIAYQNFLPFSSQRRQTVEKQQELLRSVFGVLCSRADNVSNFVEAESIFGPDSRLVYKHYATLYFVIVFDSSENELAMLDLIQGQKTRIMSYVPSGYINSVPVISCHKFFVETLDKCFRNVSELDMVFNYSKDSKASISEISLLIACKISNIGSS
ncbi:hypothetical protein DKX38_007775 [Salix brachista]|uniref:AP complex subunit sigma n=1 Tax=Salix brachista TaxID=2182728 RepID=A0A5N5MRP8_9ROSI|nr:hypothetical protein DKX38_007775 [Salix brachista]